MQYTTANGIIFQIGRIDRRHIDRISANVKEPVPPVRVVSVWGDVEEEIPILDDPVYLARMMVYRCELSRRYSAIIAPAIETDAVPNRAEIDDLIAFGITVPDGAMEQLLYTLPDADVDAIAEIVLYQSTVTVRGISEAESAYTVTWMDQPVSAWHVPSSPATYSAEFEARRAAAAQGYNWATFCELDGAEQSSVVCHWRIINKLNWLEVELERSRANTRRA